MRQEKAIIIYSIDLTQEIIDTKKSIQLLGYKSNPSIDK